MRLLATLRDSPLEVAGHAIECDGTWPRIARLRDEIWLEAPHPEPAQLVAAVRSSRLRADLITFSQTIEDPAPRHAFHRELAGFLLDSIPMTVALVDLDTMAEVRRFETDPGAIIHFGNAFEGSAPVRRNMALGGLFSLTFRLP